MNKNTSAEPFAAQARPNAAKTAILAELMRSGAFEKTNALSVVDYDALGEQIRRLRAAFPQNFLHTFAVKANYFLAVLRHVQACGMGAEVASPGELELAVKAGFDPGRIVFDAPAKTEQELERALALGIAINIDNFQEFERIKSHGGPAPGAGPVGFRINPQIGGGSVALSSTATMTSKFGVGLADGNNRARLIELYLQHDWLNAVHVHVGSVGCPLELMAEGVATAVDLAMEINNAVGGQQITSIDIGGGLPVNFEQDGDTPTFEDYARVLEARVPALFDGRFKVMTEFGRAVVSKCAFTVGKVEYTKVMGGRHIALTHLGAHNAMRVVFQPKDWARRLTALDRSGMLKTGPIIEQDVAGPCCFAGDIVGHQRALPLLEPGDLVMMHDTGAYCFSNHFGYNAMLADPVYGARDADGKIELSVVSRGQDTDELVRAFS